MEHSSSKIKQFPIFQEMELSSSNVKFLNSGNGTFLHFRKPKPPKNSLNFRKGIFRTLA